MQIKGKGQMTTYFLYGDKNREIPFEPPEQEAAPVPAVECTITAGTEVNGQTMPKGKIVSPIVVLVIFSICGSWIGKNAISLFWNWIFGTDQIPES